jgi:hypothetical protein
LMRTYPSCSLCSASRSHFLKSLQTYLQSNISFLGNHPCLWKQRCLAQNVFMSPTWFSRHLNQTSHSWVIILVVGRIWEK